MILSQWRPLKFGIAPSYLHERENDFTFNSRFLLKTWQRIDSHTLPPTVAYLKMASTEGFTKWEKSATGIIRGLQVVAMRQV